MSNRVTRSDTISRLAQSREEIRRVLEPPPHVAPGAHEAAVDNARGGAFPRSRTMRMLMSGRGIGTVGAVVGGLLMARPSLAFRMLRALPTGAVARMLMVKAVTAFRQRHR